jgi:glycyl-tRNA synthetase
VVSIIDTVANLAKRRGLVYQSGEIYGGTKSAWDYGPLGVELKENIKRQWWRSVVTGRDDVVGLDSAIILPREVWIASGHVAVFNDPLVECLNCHKRHRQDPAGGVRGEEGSRGPGYGADDRDRLPRLRHQGAVDRAA